jgi:peptidyl-prolyl cis-trans isomerase SurA
MRLIARNPAVARTFAVIALAAIGAAAACAQSATAAPPAIPAPSSASAAAGQPVLLDRVVAVINDDVILESDVQEEVRFTDLQAGRIESGTSAQQSALERLIDRYLILQQIKAIQAQVEQPTDEQVQQQISDLRKQIPQCAEQHCETEAGWRAFLDARGLTEKEVEDHWRQRMLILAFIQSRFGAGIRISEAEIEDYYKKNLVAEFARRKRQPPPLSAVSSRIQEILLQQHVNTFLDEWLQSLKDEGNVSILDADYNAASTPPEQTPGGGP